ncbi:YwqI/YxiC family protein [Virgibacillus sp. MSJ-26]|uniref:YwqI/YxiC family protein n=1 Tax=Virgibacillus sp. MSJ-26 TaxID=2841522 RepID=UPI001C104012|nr:YwqI/YxiC family protein [Virgibacillus sp. MSJ-26]MBU5465355.1 YwqI/YxiC family protein [Virgibacillus sp. MSJ-26]
MSGEIKVTRVPVEQGISELRSSIQGLETTFGQDIEGDNKLEVVTLYNEIKQECDELLVQFKALFENNVQSTDDSVAEFQETERMVAGDIRLMK